MWGLPTNNTNYDPKSQDQFTSGFCPTVSTTTTATITAILPVFYILFYPVVQILKIKACPHSTSPVNLHRS